MYDGGGTQGSGTQGSRVQDFQVQLGVLRTLANLFCCLDAWLMDLAIAAALTIHVSTLLASLTGVWHWLGV